MKFTTPTPLTYLTLLALSGAAAQAQYTQFDLSTSYNYDAVATSNELSTNVPDNGNFLSESPGQHSITNQRAYINQGSVGSGTAFTDSGDIGGKYTVSTVFDNGTDYLTPVSNVVRLSASGTGTIDTFTLNLQPGEQGQYTAFNFLSVVERDDAKAGYRTWVEAIYSDGAEIVLDTGLSDSGDTVRGTIGYDNLEKLTDSTTFVNQAPGATNTAGVSNAYPMNRGLGITGSSNAIRSDDRGIWEVDYDALTVGTADIPLDSGRTLLGLSFNIRSAGVNRDQDLYIAAVSATPVPEPATYALFFAAGVLAMTLWRRQRR